MWQRKPQHIRARSAGVESLLPRDDLLQVSIELRNGLLYIAGIGQLLAEANQRATQGHQDHDYKHDFTV